MSHNEVTRGKIVLPRNCFHEGKAECTEHILKRFCKAIGRKRDVLLSRTDVRLANGHREALFCLRSTNAKALSSFDFSNCAGV